MRLDKDQLRAYIFKEYVVRDPIDRGLSDKTVTNRKNCLKRFYRWLDGRSFSADSCRAWLRYLKDKGLRPVSIKDAARVLRATVRFLYRRKVISDDFASDIPLPKIPKTSLKIVPAELAEKIIIAGTESGEGDNSINKRLKEEHRQALRFVLRTGLRSKEICSLKGCDINLDDESFTVLSKGGDVDVLPLPKDMIDELAKRVNNARLFEITSKTLNISLKRGCERLGVTTRVRTHTLRHVFSVSLSKRGVPFQMVSKLMRHKSVDMTFKTYSQFMIDDLREHLNAKHPLIFKSLNPDDVFQSIKKSVESIVPSDDKRFEVQIRADRIIVRHIN